MADFKNLKKEAPKTRSGLGAPPKAEEIKDNLSKPGTAPMKVEENKPVGRPVSARTARLTLATTPEFKKQLKLLSVNTDMDICEIN
jgi:hypothetical protein